MVRETLFNDVVYAIPEIHFGQGNTSLISAMPSLRYTLVRKTLFNDVGHAVPEIHFGQGNTLQ